MHKILISIAVFFTLLVGGIWYYQSTHKDEGVTVITTSSSQNDDGTILLYPESGDVTYRVTPDAAPQKAVTSPTLIPNQAIVDTGIGRATILLPDNSSISLDNNTEITVNYSKKKTTMYQKFGMTYHRVEALLSGSTYQVQTPGTLAAVRGTKFAVRYDAKTKKTKVSVTEHKVEVSTVPSDLGAGVASTTQKSETVIVEEGKMMSVEAVKEKSGSLMQLMHSDDMKKDKEMNTWVEENKKNDNTIELLKKAEPSKDVYRDKVKEMFLDSTKNNKELEAPVKEESSLKKDDEVTSIKKTDTQNSEVVKKTIDELVPIKKMDDEEFYTTFEPLFIKYFYIDDTDSTCDVRVTPEERVKIVSDYATKNGHPFSNITLLSFAKTIDTYCIDKNKDTKARLQDRFDDEYPFTDNSN